MQRLGLPDWILALVLLPVMIQSQPYSYIYFKGPGAKEPTFSFNLTHPGEKLSLTRNRSSIRINNFPVASGHVRGHTTTSTTTTTTISPLSTSIFDDDTTTLGPFEYPQFLSEGNFAKSPVRSQRNRASHMTKSERLKEQARNEEDDLFLFPVTRKTTSTRSVPSPLPKANNIPSDDLFKPYKFPKGTSGIMVRLPGGASYFVDFTANTFSSQPASLPPPSASINRIPTTPADDSTSSKAGLIKVTTRRPFEPTRTQFSADQNFLFSRPKSGGFTTQTEFKDSSRFTNRPAVTRAPSVKQQHFQEGTFFSSNGTISAVQQHTTRQPFQHIEEDAVIRVNSRNLVSRNPSTVVTKGQQFDYEENAFVDAQRDFTRPARPVTQERGRTDEVSAAGRRQVPTRDPQVVQTLREKLREQNDRDFNDQRDPQPNVAIFEPVRRFNTIEARPVSKAPERTRKPSSRQPTAPTSTGVTDVFRTTTRPTTRKQTTQRFFNSNFKDSEGYSTPYPSVPHTDYPRYTTSTARPTRAPALITRPPPTRLPATFAPQFTTDRPFPASHSQTTFAPQITITTRRPFVTTQLQRTSPPQLSTRRPISSFPTTRLPPTFAPVTFPPVTFAPVTFPPATFPPATYRPTTFVPPTIPPTQRQFTTFRPITTSRPLTTTRPFTTTRPTTTTTTARPTNPPRSTTQKQFTTTIRDYVATTRGDQCPEKRYNSRHTNCVPKTCKTQERGLRNGDMEEILYAHNKYRAEVATGSTQYTHLPQASDMMFLEWDDDLAALAQAHADICSFDHDCPACRRLSKFASVGQNLCLDQTSESNPQGNWTACITRWFEEAAMTRPNDIHPYRFVQATGHFTQMLWSRTWKIGCGYTVYASRPPYKHDLLYTCNYGPAGNTIGENIYERGAPCNTCPKGTKCMKNEFFGLCESQTAAGPLPPSMTNPSDVVLLSCNFNAFKPNDCEVLTNGPFTTNAPFAIGSHTEVILRAGQQARLSFKKPIPSDNPICVIVNYDIGPNEFGKTSYGKMTLTVTGANYEAEGAFGDPNDEGVRKFFYNVDTLGIVKKLELSFVFSVPSGSADTFFDLYSVDVIQETCYDYYQRTNFAPRHEEREIVFQM